MPEPKLRFKSSDGSAYPDLCTCKIGDHYTERNESGNSSLPFLTVSIHSGISDGELDEDALGKRVKRSTDPTAYKRVEPGDLVFNMMRAWQGAVGCAKTAGMVSPAYIVATPDDQIYPPYMDLYVQSKVVVDQFNKLSYGALDFRKRLYWDSFVTAKVSLPCIDEQKQIAEFISAVDETIANCEEEIVNLETQKKAVMKKIFSREVRFKRDDGSDFPEWNSKTLGNLVGRVSSGKDKNEAGSIPLYGSMGPIGTCLTASHKGNKILVARVGANAGSVRLVTEDCGVTDNTLIIQDKQKCDFTWLYYALFEKDIGKMRFGGGQPLVTGSMLFELDTELPCHEEQRLIADFLSDFDDAITAAKKELKLWKELKRGLLQQMFV